MSEGREKTMRGTIKRAVRALGQGGGGPVVRDAEDAPAWVWGWVAWGRVG